MFVIWLFMAFVAFVGQQHWIALLKITNPAALWETVLIGLASLWLPMVKGVLQGLQNFLGLGWGLILVGVGRFGAILAILWLAGQVPGGVAGGLNGQGGSPVTGALRNRAMLG